MKKSRVLQITINGVYFLLSMTFVVSGYLALREHFYSRSSWLSKYVIADSVVSMYVGGLLFILAISSLIGILTENNRIMYICICIVMVNLGFKIGITLSSYFMQKDALKLILNWLHSAQTSYVTSYTSSETWDSIQRHVECCGVDSYEEWYKYLKDFNVPDSCCINSTVGCGQMAVNRKNVYTTSCYTAIYEWFSKQKTTQFVLSAVLLPLQLTSILLTSRFL